MVLDYEHFANEKTWTKLNNKVYKNIIGILWTKYCLSDEQSAKKQGKQIHVTVSEWINKFATQNSIVHYFCQTHTHTQNMKDVQREILKERGRVREEIGKWKRLTDIE